MRLIRAVIAALAVSAVAVGCSDGKISTTPVPPTGTSASAPVASAPGTPTGAPAAAPQAEVGDTLDLTGDDVGARMAVEVTRVVDPAPAADEFSNPDPGDRLVSVQFSLRNTGSAVYSDSPSNGAQIVDSSGQGYDSSFDNTSAGPPFPAIEHVAPGDSALGYVTFEVPDGVRVAQVQLTLDSGYADDTGQWDVNRSVAGSAPSAAAPAAPQPAAPQPAAPPPTSQSTPSTPSDDPGGTVESYYADINAHDYSGAWSLGGKNLDHSYQDFASGFAGTRTDTVTVDSVNGDTASVSLDALQTDGSHHYFSGSYTVKDGIIVSADIH